jgi:YesN/AraC family two-component response regulator
MSRDLSLSTAYLGKYFKEQTGITLLDFVTRFRIERAKHLLAQSDLPLQDIVEQTGATNVSSFIRKFKKTMAMTPGEYRTLVKDQKVNNGS